MLHPSAFVLHGQISIPLADDHLQLLADGYKLKYLQHELSDERIEDVKFRMFHESKGGSYLLDGEDVLSHPVMIRTNGEVILTSTGEKIGDIRKLLP